MKAIVSKTREGIVPERHDVLIDNDAERDMLRHVIKYNRIQGADRAESRANALQSYGTNLVPLVDEPLLVTAAEAAYAMVSIGEETEAAKTDPRPIESGGVEDLVAYLASKRTLARQIRDVLTVGSAMANGGYEVGVSTGTLDHELVEAIPAGRRDSMLNPEGMLGAVVARHMVAQ